MVGRSQRAIGGFFGGFPAGSLPGLRLLSNAVLKSLITRDFLGYGELEKIFTLSFPVRQGKMEAALPRSPPPKPVVATGSVDHCGARSTAMPCHSDLKPQAIEVGIGLGCDRAPEALFERA